VSYEPSFLFLSLCCSSVARFTDYGCTLRKPVGKSSS